MLGNRSSAGRQPRKSLTEIDVPLSGSGQYQIVKLWDHQFLPTQEFADNIQEASGRIEYLNNRSRKAFYMVKKLC